MHPELLEGEEFLINLTEFEIESGLFDETPSFLEYVRIGVVAYSSTGEIISNMKPLFAKPRKS